MVVLLISISLATLISAVGTIVYLLEVVVTEVAAAVVVAAAAVAAAVLIAGVVADI